MLSAQLSQDADGDCRPQQGFKTANNAAGGVNNALRRVSPAVTGLLAPPPAPAMLQLAR